MAKKRKTREEKKLADLRHNFSHALVNQINADGKISLSANQIKIDKVAIKQQPKTRTISSVNEYPFLVKDLSKTAILTSAILTFQVILFLLLTNHTFVIPGLSY